MNSPVAADVRRIHSFLKRFSLLMSAATAIVVMTAYRISASEVKLITLDPGHFHAALVQKSMYPHVNKEVHVYGPDGADLKLHLGRISDFNSRAENPTHWIEKVYCSIQILLHL